MSGLSNTARIERDLHSGMNSAASIDAGNAAEAPRSKAESCITAESRTRLGFEVDDEPNSLQQALERAMRAIRERDLGKWSTELHQVIVHEIPGLLRDHVPDGFGVKGSVGFGNQAEIPWVAVLPPGVGGASEGRYVVYLFAADGETVYLSLSQAVRNQPKKGLATLADDLRVDAGEQPDLLTTVDLRATGDLGLRYELGTAYATPYEAGRVPPQADLERHLQRFLALLEKTATPRATRGVWVFQGNPAVYDLYSAVRDRDEITFVVRQYTNEVRPGDRVYVWRSAPDAGVVAVATVADEPTERRDDLDDPFWRDSTGFESPEMRVTLRVEQVVEPPLLRSDLLNHAVLKNLEVIRFANATNFRVTTEQDAELQALISGVPVWPVPDLRLADEALAASVYLPVTWLQEILDLLASKQQIVFFGPPGTGKTKVALELSAHLTADGGDYRIVQFHPSYSYEDFFEGYRPLTRRGQLEYELAPGALRQISEAARVDPAHPYILIVDEINRGNIPKIFGELLFLLEYRESAVRPQYSPDKPFTLPANLFVIGTMNTADRSIALVDIALRRRFYFQRFSPLEEPVRSVLEHWLHGHGLDTEPAAVLDELNAAIVEDEVAIGPSYFMTREGTPPDLERIWTNAILPLLEEYYYGTGRNVHEEFSLERIRKRIKDGGAAAVAEPESTTVGGPSTEPTASVDEQPV